MCSLLCPSLAQIGHHTMGVLSSNFEFHHVSVFDDIFFPFRTNQALFASFCPQAALEKFVPLNNVGADEFVAKAGVDRGACPRRSRATSYRPRTALLLSRRKERDKVE